MARLAWLGILLFPVLPAPAQQQTDTQLKEAGVCARCHVISVVEWGMSAHRSAGTNCVSCHGESRGHVVDERNNIKPDRIPRGEKVASLCATCHQAACPKTKKAGECQSCHHFHALIDPKKPPVAKDEEREKLAAKWQSASRHSAEGERLMKSGQHERARVEFEAALRDRPGDPRLASRLAACARRLQTGFSGFEILGTARDDETGLPKRVRVSGTEIEMVLVPGGDVNLGSDKFPGAKPLHTVRVAPFYAAVCETSQAQWKALMRTDPSAHKGAGLPVEMVSWVDAQEFLEKLNARVAGAGFRLPSEAEWEHAARAGGPVPAESLLRIAWFDGPERAASPHPAGSKQPNALGLFDIFGNVWEWCSSRYLPYPYDATDGRESASAGGLRVLRGGGYADTAAYLNPALRHGERPDRRLPWNGFRIARSAP